MTELHLHLDGSMRPQTIFELASHQGIALPAADAKALRAYLEVPADCPSLTDYLKRFDLPLAVLQTPDALERAVFELSEDLWRLGVDRAEIRFAPQFSTSDGMTQDDAVCAAVAGARRAMETYPAFRCGLILCCMRGSGNMAANEETLRLVRKHLPGGVVCAIDLAGAEAFFPTSDYAGLFEQARAQQIPMTIHAGEAAGPESIRQALSFGTKRIGHGITAAGDPALVRQLAEAGVTLEVCPTSNVQTKGAVSLEQHPIRALFDAGVRVTVNSDNMTVSNIDLPREIALLKTHLGFTGEEIGTMQRYAREASFLRD